MIMAAGETIGVADFETVQLAGIAEPRTRSAGDMSGTAV